MSDIKLVILEGVDKVGKTTIYQTYRKATNYGPLVIDRFIGSNYAYDVFVGRDSLLEEKTYRETEKGLMGIFDCYLVYLCCSDYPKLEERLICGEEDLYSLTIRNIGLVQHMFEKYYHRCKFTQKIKIDTCKCSINDVRDKILTFTKEEKVGE